MCIIHKANMYNTLNKALYFNYVNYIIKLSYIFLS